MRTSRIISEPQVPLIRMRKLVLVCAAAVATVSTAATAGSGPSALAWTNVTLYDYALKVSPLDLPPNASIGISASSPADPPGWKDCLSWSTYCFSGTVVDVKYECGDFPSVQPTPSAALVEFLVTDSYWGLNAERAIVVVCVTRPDCPVTYKWPTFCEFTPGEKYLILGPRGSWPNRIIYRNIFRVYDAEVMDESGLMWPRTDVDSAIEIERRVRNDQSGG